MVRGDEQLMPISLPVPHGLERDLHQLLSEILRRAEDGTFTSTNVVVVGASGSKYFVGVDTDGALTVTSGAVGDFDTNGITLTDSNGVKYRLGVDNDGALTVNSGTTGIILTAPNGAQYLLGVDIDEALTTTPL